MSTALARALVRTLPSGQSSLFNPWADVCELDTPENTPAAKLDRLAQHLSVQPRLILVGEAPGYQGCRFAGLAFTSEHLLLEGAIPRVPREPQRLTTRERAFREPSATIVWKALYRLGLAEQTVLWNAVQLHPVGHTGPLSNRTPSDDELALGAPALRLLRETFPLARFVAIGRKAEAALSKVDIQAHAAIRHPANGGATAFGSGLATVAAQLQ